MATVGLFRHQYCGQTMESNIVRKIAICDGVAEKCVTLLLTNHNVSPELWWSNIILIFTLTNDCTVNWAQLVRSVLFIVWPASRLTVFRWKYLCIMWLIVWCDDGTYPGDFSNTIMRPQNLQVYANLDKNPLWSFYSSLSINWLCSSSIMWWFSVDTVICSLSARLTMPTIELID